MKNMVLIESENWWPAHKSAEVGKIYLEAMKKYPEDKSIEKPLIRGAIWTTEEGMHSISVYSIKPGKMRESLDLTSNRLLMIASIEGFRYRINIAYDLVEAMPFVGLTAP